MTREEAAAKVRRILAERVPARMTQHVRVCFYPSSPLDHSGEASRSKWSTALGREHEGRLRLLFSLKPPEGAQFVAKDWMRAGRALLDPTDVQGGRSEVNLLPA